MFWLVDLAVVANVGWRDQLLQQSEWYRNKQMKASWSQAHVKSSQAFLLWQDSCKPDKILQTIKARFKYLLTIFLQITVGHYGKKQSTSFGQEYLIVHKIGNLEKLTSLFYWFFWFGKQMKRWKKNICQMSVNSKDPWDKSHLLLICY